MKEIKDKSFEIFISAEALAEQITAVAEQLNREYAGKNPVFVSILNGSFIFTADLLRKITIPCEISFIKVASYHAMQSSGQVKNLIGLNEELAGRHVVILEDIVDTGITMEGILNALEVRNPASVRMAVLLFKAEALQKKISPDYVCFRIPNRFVVGYGLDYDGYGRNLPDLYVLKEN